jgi:hypothetical protein
LLTQLAEALGQPPDQIKPVRGFTDFERAAISFLAAIDPQSFETLVKPEIERRLAEPLIEAERMRQERAEQAGRIESLVRVAEIREGREREEQSLEALMASTLTASDGAAQEIQALVPSLDSTTGAQVRRRSRAMQEIARQVRANPTAENVAFLGQYTDGLLDFVESRQTLASAAGGLSDSIKKVVSELDPILLAADDALALIDAGVYGSGKATGGFFGQSFAALADMLGHSGPSEELEDLRIVLSLITGKVNRVLGGGAALTELEERLMAGMFVQISDRETVKRRRLLGIKRFIKAKKRVLLGQADQSVADRVLLEASGFNKRGTREGQDVYCYGDSGSERCFQVSA